MKALVAQSRAEIMMTLRRGESLLLAIGIPVAALVCFSSLHILDTGPGRSINFLTPGILALAIMSTAMVNVAISTGFERYYGVLKRLGSTPLGRPSLIGAKTVSVLVVEIIQAIVLIVVGLFLGWHPGLQGSAAGAGSGIGIVVILQAIAAAGIATVGFAALGMLMAGRLSAFLILGLANGLWFAMLMVSGMFSPLSKLPSTLRTISELLPSTALAQAFHMTLQKGESVSMEPWLVLIGWAFLASVAASRLFRWE